MRIEKFLYVIGSFRSFKSQMATKIFSYEGPFGVGYLVAQLT